jgi:hypothetical protein
MLSAIAAAFMRTTPMLSSSRRPWSYMPEMASSMETIVGKRGVSTALGAIEEGSERGCASRRSARARGGADEEVLDDVGAFNASNDLLIAAA